MIPIDILLIIISASCNNVDYTWYYGLGESMEDYYGIEYGIACFTEYYDFPHKYARIHIYIWMDDNAKPPIDLKGNWAWTDYGKSNVYMRWQPHYDKLNSWIISHEHMHMKLFEDGYDRDQIERKLMHSFQPESKQDYYFYYNDKFLGYILYKKDAPMD